MLGDRMGGLSLWLARLGYNVLCTDYSPLDNAVRLLHERWQVQDRIVYVSADVFGLKYPDDYFDMVTCKSVIGGLSLDHADALTRSLENQKLAVEEIRRVLKPGGVFLGAENLTGSKCHMAMRKFLSNRLLFWRYLRRGNSIPVAWRKMRLRSALGWRFLQMSEIQWLFEGYSQCEQKPHGFVGTHWPQWCGLNLLCAPLDRCLSRILPASWLYISFIRARK